MNIELKKRMLSECRCVTYVPAKEKKSADDAQLVKAMTVNENLLTLGYTLTPADLARLAVSDSLDTFYEDVKGLMGDVKTAPMYPDFPTQVMEMSEAQFRFHQMLHYLSTYGLEELFGGEVKKGWLPSEEGTPKTEKDTVLLEAKVLELLPEDEAARVLSARILARRERMTLPEKELVCFSLDEISAKELEKFEIPFKENLRDIFIAVEASCEKEQAFRTLRALCKHTGDVFKCAELLLGRYKYHLRTSQKRFLVKLLESYPVTDFKANLILSSKKAEKSLRVLQYLDYNIYSRSDAHKEAVRDLRDGELHSWEGQARYLLSVHDDGALEFVAKRPGMMLRMVAWMIRLGYDPKAIEETLMENAGQLSGQTIVTTLVRFGDYDFYEKEVERKKEIETVFSVFAKLLPEKLKAQTTPLLGKKVYVDMGGYDLARSVMQCNDKSEEGGYVRSGTVYRIPEHVRRIRFFVYWNDVRRVDIDLHAAAYDLQGKKIEIGWNEDYKGGGIVFSGDITHSDAAEFIDIDLEEPIREVSANINIYSGKRFFGDIETCFVGMMAVDKIGQEVNLYDPANCFFCHELRGKSRTMNYGFIDVKNRCLMLVGKEAENYYTIESFKVNRFSMQDYLDALLEAQNVVKVDSREEADVVLKMGKAEEEKDISFIDNNYFL